jgi:transposase
MTELRKALGQLRTRTLNKIHRIINGHNLIWNYLTKSFQTQAGRRWLETVKLPELDRLEMDMLLKEWTTWDEQIAQMNERTVERANHREPGEIVSAAQILMTAPGVSHYSALALSSRIGPIERLPRPRSLANIRPNARISQHGHGMDSAMHGMSQTIVLSN